MAVTKRFYQQLSILTLFIGLVLAALQYFNLLGGYPSFSWTCFIFFSLITPLTILLASLSQKSSKASKGLYIIMGSMGLKFLMSLAIIIIYYLVVRPTEPKFILPFFLLYTIYTVLETKMLLQMTHKKKT